MSVLFQFVFLSYKTRSILWPLSGAQSPRRVDRRELDSPHPVCFGFICPIDGFIAVVLVNYLQNRIDAAYKLAGSDRRKSSTFRSASLPASIQIMEQCHESKLAQSCRLLHWIYAWKLLWTKKFLQITNICNAALWMQLTKWLSPQIQKINLSYTAELTYTFIFTGRRVWAAFHTRSSHFFPHLEFKSHILFPTIISTCWCLYL